MAPARRESGPELGLVRRCIIAMRAIPVLKTWSRRASTHRCAAAVFLLAAVCGASGCEVKERPFTKAFENEPSDGKPNGMQTGTGGTGSDVAMPSMLAQGAVCRPGVDVCNGGL